MARMPEPERVLIIAKERPFDKESAKKWKQLLTAFAYVLHEQRTTQGQGDNIRPDDSGRNVLDEKSSGEGP